MNPDKVAKPRASAQQASSLMRHLQALQRPQGFRDIWMDAAWLDDGLELRRDQEALSALLDIASRSEDVEQTRTALHFAIALFRLHADSGCPRLDPLRAALECMKLIAEQLEAEMDAGSTLDDPAVLMQIASLKLHLGTLAMLENEPMEAPQRPRLPPPAVAAKRRPFAGSHARLRQRSELLRNAHRFLTNNGPRAGLH